MTARQSQMAPYSASLPIVVDADCCALADTHSIQDSAVTTLHVFVNYLTAVATPGQLIQAA